MFEEINVLIGCLCSMEAKQRLFHRRMNGVDTMTFVGCVFVLYNIGVDPKLVEQPFGTKLLQLHGVQMKYWYDCHCV